MDAISGEEHVPKATEPSLSDQVSTLADLARVVRDANLSELELEHEGVRLRLAAPRAAAAPSGPPAGAPAAPGFAPQYFAHADEAPIAEVVPAKSTGVEVLSPMVGLFYRAPSPSDPNYVEVGDHVEVGKTLGLVEAMKTYNEITSEVSGTVLEIRAANSALIETGDVLMTIQPD